MFDFLAEFIQRVFNCKIIFLNKMFNFYKKKSASERCFYVGDGIRLLDLFSSDARPLKIVTPEAIRNAHQYVFGGSRSGKTYLLMEYAQQAIKCGNNIILFDPKLDKFLYPAMKEAAIKAGRDEEFILINAVKPEKSTIKINPFEYLLPEEIVGHIIAGIPIGKEEFFREQARKVATVAISIDIYLNKKLGVDHPAFPINRLQRIFNYDWITAQMKILERELMYEENKQNEELKNLVSFGYSLTKLPRKQYEEVTSNLSNVLIRLGTGVVSQLINTPENELLRKLENDEGVIAYIYTGALLNPESGYTLSRVILSMLQSFIGKIYLNKGQLKRTLEIHIDEASNVMYDGISELFNKAGGCNVWLNCLTQSIADMDDKIGDKKRQVILDSCATKIFLGCGDSDKTGAYVASLAGFINSMDIAIRSGTDLASGAMLRDKLQAILDPSSVTKLKARQFFLFGRNHGNFIGTIRNIKQPTLNVSLND